MERNRYIVVLLACACLFVPWANAKKAPKEPAPTPLSTEQEQQFTYYWYAAEQAIEKNEFDKAYVLLTFCNAIHPNDARTHRFLGIIESGIGDNLSSILHLIDAFNLAPADEWYPYYTSMKHYMADQQQEMLLPILEQAFEAQKKQQRVEEILLNELQDMYLAVGDAKKAIAMQDELDAINGYDDQSALFRALIYQSIGKSKQALREVNRYLELDPTNIRLLTVKLEIIQATAKPKEVMTLYEQLLQVHPESMLLLNNYAYYLATHKGDLNRAEQFSARTINAEPTNATFLDTYGWILHMKGQNDLALFYLRQAKEHATEDDATEEIEEHIKIVERAK